MDGSVVLLFPRLEDCFNLNATLRCFAAVANRIRKKKQNKTKKPHQKTAPHNKEREESEAFH